MSENLTEGIELAYAERSDLIVVALTGRTGSGCTTTAKVLCRSFDAISLGAAEVGGVEGRKLGIIHDFAKAKWVPFESITVSSVIWSFVVEAEWSDLEPVLTNAKVKQSAVIALQNLYESCRQIADYAAFVDCMREPSRRAYAPAWNYYRDRIESAGLSVKRELGNAYAPLFQLFGDNLRLSGSPHRSDVEPSSLFALVRRVKILTKAAFYAGRDAGRPSTRVVIDAIRNPLELLYLRDQFAAFYCMAITSDDNERVSRLLNSGVFNRSQVDAIDAKEYGSKSLKSYGSFVSQNLQECIQKADLFITNRGQDLAFDQSTELNRQLVTYIALMLRPGLVTPTRDERCMQLAFVAKVNSGCISRQVGAAVADQNYSVKAVGWNDVPKGQVPCLLRDAGALLNGNDSAAFSDYERTNRPLRDHLGKKLSNRGMLANDHGLRCPYCFKDAYNEVIGEDNQVHTRALHAEENAFLQLAKYGSGGIEHGVLYTTASPCELCSKKAYQLGVREVVYVDPYPGISAPHILGSGPEDMRPKLRLFSGAVGHAYHRLYDPLMSIKDEYAARLMRDPQTSLL